MPDVVILNRDLLKQEPLWPTASVIQRGETAPLVVEVVSTNWRDDYGHKFVEYEAMGIAERSSKSRALLTGLLAIFGLLAIASAANTASAGAPNSRDGQAARYAKEGDNRAERAQPTGEKAPRRWQNKAQYLSAVWSFCQGQKRVCVNACATFFRGRQSCTQTCRNTAHACTETACFEWKPNYWRVVARSGGQLCIDE